MTIINELQLQIARVLFVQNFIASWRPSINDVGNWKGGGVKNWSKLPMDSIKKTADRGRGCQKSGKIADVIYGWSLDEFR